MHFSGPQGEPDKSWKETDTPFQPGGQRSTGGNQDGQRPGQRHNLKSTSSAANSEEREEMQKCKHATFENRKLVILLMLKIAMNYAKTNPK